jgi:hypothetical protein
VTRDEFAHLVGNMIAHHTYAGNLPSIEVNGLMSAAALAVTAGVAPDDLALRSESARFAYQSWEVQLNHQRPLLAGRRQAQEFLDGYNLGGWARQLDARIFFLPKAHRSADPAFVASLGVDVVSLELSSLAFFDAFAPDIWLSPINSGNATRRPARRGDWLYVSVAETQQTFRMNRVHRNLVKSRDSVQEISICRAIPAEVLERLRIR